MINDNPPPPPTELQLLKTFHADVQGRADALYTLLKHVESKKIPVSPEQSLAIHLRRLQLLRARDRVHGHILEHNEGKEESRRDFDRQILQVIEAQIGKIDALLTDLGDLIPPPPQDL